jgi:hypothetical protein
MKSQATRQRVPFYPAQRFGPRTMRIKVEDLDALWAFAPIVGDAT